jgi:hypothetical protein
MTFIKGDCGGVFFHSIHRTQMFYYFYICQSVDPDPKNVCPQGKYEYGLVRHKMDPPSGEPDTNVNPLLQTGCSLFNVANSNQANIIAVLTRGSNIGLYVNQKLIYDVPDPTGYNEGYRDGAIGVFAKAFALYRPTEVAFSDATVWKL